MLATCVASSPVGVVQLAEAGIGVVQNMIESELIVAVVGVNVKVYFAFWPFEPLPAAPVVTVPTDELLMLMLRLVNDAAPALGVTFNIPITKTATKPRAIVHSPDLFMRC